jgi:replication-associated recombination protein RarA
LAKPRLIFQKFLAEKMARRMSPLRIPRLPLPVAFPMLNAMAEHTVTTLNKPDVALEMTLRPSLFSDFTGQPKVKERLEIAVEAAKQRGEALDHILLSGPPGLGKTTIANILAKAMGANVKAQRSDHREGQRPRRLAHESGGRRRAVH